MCSYTLRTFSCFKLNLRTNGCCLFIFIYVFFTSEGDNLIPVTTPIWGWCITGHSRFSLSDPLCSFSILFSRCSSNASHYLQLEAAHDTPDFYRVYRWALSIFLSRLSVTGNACRFLSQKVWTFDFKKSRIKAYLIFFFYVTGFTASSVMNSDDLWVDFETGIVLSTNRNQGIFLCLFWLSHRLIHKQNLLFSVALAKNEKAERTYFKKSNQIRESPKTNFPPLPVVRIGLFYIEIRRNARIKRGRKPK